MTTFSETKKNSIYLSSTRPRVFCVCVCRHCRSGGKDRQLAVTGSSHQQLINICQLWRSHGEFPDSVDTFLFISKQITFLYNKSPHISIFIPKPYSGWTAINSLLTSCSRVLLEKLTGFAANQEIPQHFMEPESSLPYSQAPATCPYPQPTPSSPHNPFPLPQDPS